MDAPKLKLNIGMWRLSMFVLVISFIPVHESAKKKENCEYDMDLTRNVIKIVCDGSASSVNVYAETAHVQSDEGEIEDERGGGGGEGGGGDNNQNHNNNVASGSASGGGRDSSNSNNNDASNGDGRTPSQPSRRRTNKELRGAATTPGDGGSNNVRMSADHSSAGGGGGGGGRGGGGGGGGNWDFSEYSPSPFVDVVWNATQKLDDARRKLSNYATYMADLDVKLDAGDVDMRTDMDKLRRTSNTATELKEGIIVAMSNQFHFMRGTLVAQNEQLGRIMKLMDVLVNVTNDGFHSALMAHKSNLQQIHRLNYTLSAVRRMVSSELRKRLRRRGLKKGNNTKTCPKEISAIGSGFSRRLDSERGAYMVESYSTGGVSSVWIMKGADSNDQIIQYDTPTDIDYQIIGRYYALPFSCRGTGHAVFKRHFYCHVKDTNTVVKYHLKKMDIISEVVLPGTHYERFLYKAHAHNEIDLAVDEQGLWAIYASEESRGRLVISKINHQKMEVEKTWVTSQHKMDTGNAFMICGTLYATHSHSDAPTYIRYMYNTETSTDLNLEPGQISFPNAVKNMTQKRRPGDQPHVAKSVMLSYDFRSSNLYSWSDSRVESYPVYFNRLEL